MATSAPRTVTGTVLSIETLPTVPGTRPAGPPPYYRWRQRTTHPEEELRRVHAIAGTMGVAMVEVVTGQRPIAQLSRWVHPDVLARLARRTEIESPAGAATEEPGQVRRRFGSDQLRPRRVRATRAATFEYEASVVIDEGSRCRALALRIRKTVGQWQIVAAEIG